MPPPASRHRAILGLRFAQAVAAGRFEEAVKEAETRQVKPNAAQAAILAAAYAGSAKAIRATNGTQAATQAVRAGQLYLETANRPEDALEPLRLAIAINPADARAQMLLSSAKNKAADIHYRSGVAAFQKQDLDGDIAVGSKTLAIDPDHKNAQLNRAQAMELKQNFYKDCAEVLVQDAGSGDDCPRTEVISVASILASGCVSLFRRAGSMAASIAEAAPAPSASFATRA